MIYVDSFLPLCCCCRPSSPCSSQQLFNIHAKDALGEDIWVKRLINFNQTTTTITMGILDGLLFSQWKILEIEIATTTATINHNQGAGWLSGPRASTDETYAHTATSLGVDDGHVHYSIVLHPRKTIICLISSCPLKLSHNSSAIPFTFLVYSGLNLVALFNVLRIVPSRPCYRAARPPLDEYFNWPVSSVLSSIHRHTRAGWPRYEKLSK